MFSVINPKNQKNIILAELRRSLRKYLSNDGVSNISSQPYLSRKSPKKVLNTLNLTTKIRNKKRNKEFRKNKNIIKKHS